MILSFIWIAFKVMSNGDLYSEDLASCGSSFFNISLHPKLRVVDQRSKWVQISGVDLTGERQKIAHSHFPRRPKSQTDGYFYEGLCSRNGSGPNQTTDWEGTEALPVEWHRKGFICLDESVKEDIWPWGEVSSFRVSDHSTFRNGEIQRDATGKSHFYNSPPALELDIQFAKKVDSYVFHLPSCGVNC